MLPSKQEISYYERYKQYYNPSHVYFRNNIHSFSSSEKETWKNKYYET